MKVTEIAHNDNNRNSQYGKVWFQWAMFFFVVGLRSVIEELDKPKDNE